MAFNKKSLTGGILLIVIGLIFLSNNLGVFYISWDIFWPWIMLVGGVLFLLGWLADRRKFGLLMPASLLIIYGILFLYCVYLGWWQMEQLWPIFIISPGIGFLLMYLFGEKEISLLIPGGILIGLGILFLIGEGTARFFWPLLLITIGVWLLLRGRKKGEDSLTKPSEIQTGEVTTSESTDQKTTENMDEEKKEE